MLDVKLGIRSQPTPIPNSQTAEDVVDQTHMLYQDIRRNTTQVYIKYKAYYDKKANASRLKQAYYLYVWQPQADHQ